MTETAQPQTDPSGVTSMVPRIPGLPGGVIESLQRQVNDRDRLIGQNAALQQRGEQRFQQNIGAAYDQYGQAQAAHAAAADPGPPPPFVPTRDNVGDFATLFSLLGVVGGALGGKGKSASMMAMSSMTGMLEGWQQGRADLYQRELKQFEAALQQYRAQADHLKAIYERAMQGAQINLQKATAQAESELRAVGADIAANTLRIQGLTGLSQIMPQLIQAYESFENRAQQMRARAEEQRFQHEENRLNREQQLRVAEIQSQRAINNQFRNVWGQQEYLRSMGIPETVRLGPTEVSKTASTLEAATLANQLSEEIRLHPEAAGLAGSILGRIDRLDFTRYFNGNEQDPGLVASALNAIVGETPISGPPDRVAQARSIAKMAVDVMNARALAASGGGRMLISELNIQKSVIGLSGQSAESAVTVYRNMANRDIEGLWQFNLQRYIPHLQEQARAHALERMRSQEPAAPAAPAASANAMPGDIMSNQAAPAANSVLRFDADGKRLP